MAQAGSRYWGWARAPEGKCPIVGDGGTSSPGVPVTFPQARFADGALTSMLSTADRTQTLRLIMEDALLF